LHHRIAGSGVAPHATGPGHGVLGLFDALRREEQPGTITYLQVKRAQASW